MIAISPGDRLGSRQAKTPRRPLERELFSVSTFARSQVGDRLRHRRSSTPPPSPSQVEHPRQGSTPSPSQIEHRRQGSTPSPQVVNHHRRHAGRGARPAKDRHPRHRKSSTAFAIAGRRTPLSPRIDTTPSHRESRSALAKATPPPSQVVDHLCPSQDSPLQVTDSAATQTHQKNFEISIGR
jgi:hypothetical protein